jgi:hypothetical protein
MKIQYISDIHLERLHHRLGKIPQYKPNAPFLFLAGDIGNPRHSNYKEFMVYASLNWEKVYLVTGNHEYTHFFSQVKKKRETDELIQEHLEHLSNVKHLNCSSDTIGSSVTGGTGGVDYKIVGCTLWCEHDNKNIADQHKIERDWLHKEITTSKENLIVMTHYLPSYQLIPKRFKNFPLRHRYATNLEYLLKPPVRAWFCGHSHMRVRQYIGTVPVFVNAATKSLENVVFDN